MQYICKLFKKSQSISSLDSTVSINAVIFILAFLRTLNITSLILWKFSSMQNFMARFDQWNFCIRLRSLKSAIPEWLTLWDYKYCVGVNVNDIMASLPNLIEQY
jgi:hypothetical protein